MKKIILTAVIAMFGLTGLKAQSTGFEAGAFIGFPIGDAGNVYSFNFGVNAVYYWTVGENFKAGAMTGFDHWTGKSFNANGNNGGGGNTQTKSPYAKGSSNKFADASFIPLAASARYDFGGFFGGLDLGYAIGASSGNNGGFYYRPRAGYGTTTFDFYGFYKGISANGGSISSLGLGFDYKF